MLDLTDQVAIVTGASRGIGRAIAMALADCGAHVILAARDSDALATAAGGIIASGGRATAIPTDVTDEPAVTALFDRVHRDHARLDILINNAGIGIFSPLAEMPAADFDHVLQVNLRGTYLCCRHAMRRMIAQQRGTIINIASVVGFKGYPNQAAYTASKHGVMGLTKSLAVEAQPHGIRVSAILPGGVDTDMVGDARPDLDRSQLLAPEDIAQTVLYLLSLSDRAAIDQIYIRRRASQPF